ncbi:hypothetical protein LXL04_020851 [Taraxacum kok-saghyz]
MEHEDVMEDASVTINDHVDVDVEVNDEDTDDSIEEIDPDSQGVESTSTKKRKTRTLKSEVWQWFTIIKKKPNDTGPSMCVCNKCGQKYKAGSDQGTGNLKRHHKKCEKEKTRDIGQYMIASNSGAIDMRNPKFSQAKFRELLIEGVVRHDLPFSFVEYEGMRKVWKYLESNTSNICRNTAKADIQKLYKTQWSRLRGELLRCPSRICLTSDAWTSIVTDGYLSLTAHYVDQNWVL